MAPIKVLMMSTYIYSSSNGYSKCSYELCSKLAKYKNIDLTVWGFQRFNQIPNQEHDRPEIPGVKIIDAFANEEPKGMGFGFDQIAEHMNNNSYDVVIIYNDMVVVSNILEKFKTIKSRPFKTIVYVDQVYLSQRKEFIHRLNTEVDHILCFSKFWEDCIIGQGLTKPTTVINHGISQNMHYPVPKKLARLYYNISPDDFVVINSNRSQPRKRLDIMMIAWAEFVSRHLAEPIKLLIATNPISGCWNLIEIYERELKKRSISMENGMKHIILLDNPQMMNDEDMNILYNAADVGLNTCQGEGWGMTNFELGAIGKGNIVPAIGGLLDFFDSDSAIQIQPVINLYTDTSSDGAPGECQICHPNDYVEAIETYYANKDILEKHGKNARKNILAKYQWSDIGKTLYDAILKVADVTEIIELTDEDVIDIVETTIIPDKKKEEKPVQVKKITNIKERLQAKLAAKKKLKDSS